jgi:UDP-N-acetylmuramate--alanine ligase
VLGPFALVAASLEARAVIKRRDPAVVLGLGGFASFPGALMAVATGRPLAIHDSNAVAGLANRVLAHGADRILLGFPNAMRGKHAKLCEWTGNPLRAAMTRVAPPQQRFADRSGPLRCSSSAEASARRASTSACPAAVARLSQAQRPRIVHQAGAKHIDALKAAYRDAGVEAECVAFIDDMAGALCVGRLRDRRAAVRSRCPELAAVGWVRSSCRCPARSPTSRRRTRTCSSTRRPAFRIAQDELTGRRARGAPRAHRPADGARHGDRGAQRGQDRRRRARRRRLPRARGGAAMKGKVRRIHFVGIGGAGMSGIAEVLATQGYDVSGSDLHQSAVTRHLAGLGIRTMVGHDASNVAQADVVVASTAVADDNPEVVAAREQQIPVVPRALMLAELMRFKQGIAIAGTHGKTTTTSLVASVLAEGGLDPTFVIGGRLLAAGANARLGSGDYLVAEADESDASFLHLTPTIAVVTNVDHDHMETYGHDAARLKRAFVDFLQRLPFWGVAVACVDDDNVREILPSVSKAIVTYGLAPDAKLRAFSVAHAGGRMRFVATSDKHAGPRDRARAAGRAQRAQRARGDRGRARGRRARRAIARALAEFKGVGRRFQRHGPIALPGGGHAELIDDYGHHPVEIAAVLDAARGSFPDRRLVLAFQPHRYTRTRDLFEDFARVLSTVDALVLTDVYPAGEAPIVAADGRALARAIRVVGKVEPVFVENVDDVAEAVRALARDGDIVLTMGAGSIGQVAPQLAAGHA